MRKSQLGRKSRIKRSQFRPKRRTKAEQAAKLEREFGGPTRADWVSGLPCLVCATVPSENAHTSHPSAGMSRKGDACAIVPLCNFHHIETLHRIGEPAFERLYATQLAGETLAWWAERTERAWLEYSAC